MVGKTVVKLFDKVPYVGEITNFDPRTKWYKVVYKDGDQEDMTYRELRVREWPKIDRLSVLWLDEKVCLC